MTTNTAASPGSAHPPTGEGDAVVDLTTSPMAPWTPDIETMWDPTEPYPVEEQTTKLLWNAIEADDTFEHGRAAELVREFAHQLAIHADRVSYLCLQDIKYHAKAAAAMAKNAGLQRRYAGDAVTAEQVMGLLGLTRPELAQHTWDGDLICVRDVWNTVDLFPLWQFNVGEKRIRREVTILTTAYRGTMYDRDKLMLLGWVSERYPDLLPEGVSVVEWIENHPDSGADLDTIRLAIAHGARELRAIEQRLS